MNPECIVILANDPGRVGNLTDLLPILGERKTGYLNRAMLFDTLSVCLSLPLTDISVYYHQAGSQRKFKMNFNLFVREENDESVKNKVDKIELLHQNTASLSKRISSALYKSFEAGYERVIVVGTNCPSLNKTIIKAGFLLLKENQVVIGPSFNGRYYLLGMSRHIPQAFKSIDWSRQDVYVRLRSNLKNARARVQELELSYMVNTVDELNQLVHDIERWRKIGDNKTAFHTERFLRTLSG
jgi:glycosyltransferase A (GT-A) superfamily protein (DUF2064 family)